MPAGGWATTSWPVGCERRCPEASWGIRAAVSTRRFAQIEEGKAAATLDVWVRIAGALDESLDELLAGVGWVPSQGSRIWAKAATPSDRRWAEVDDDAERCLLKAERIVVETKMTRTAVWGLEVGEELIIDIERYKAHPFVRCASRPCLRSRPADSKPPCSGCRTLRERPTVWWVRLWHACRR
jgi:hypothetical protein